MAVDPELFKAGMRRHAAGVTLVTTRFEGVAQGLTATAVCSVSALPPKLLCCINRASNTFEAILGAGIFAVNLLRFDDWQLADRFGGGVSEHGEGRFALGDWGRLGTGAPILMSAPVVFDCRVEQIYDGGSHGIILGSVEEVALHGVEDPLIYLDGGYDKIALPHAD